MAKFNRKGADGRLDYDAGRLAGGFGGAAARQDAEGMLRRAVMACLLWEDLAYESGAQGAENIAALVPKVDPDRVAEIATEAREKQKLRHAPLWIAVQMLKYPEHKKQVRDVLGRVITRADQITDTVALYFKERGKKPNEPSKLPRQLKLGLADAFQRFDAYQFAKYDRSNEIKLRDVLRICHAKPDQGKEELFRQINERSLPIPDTWETALSAGENKKATWERLIETRKIGSLAFLRNLRNMVDAGVSDRTIRTGLEQVKDKGLLPLNFLAAQTAVPRYAAEIEAAMFRAYGQIEKLPGFTVFVIDVSGSMSCRIAKRSQFNRIDAGAAMAILARESCEQVSIYATAGSDGHGIHKTALLPNYRGFGLLEAIRKATNTLGGGGIFTRQCLEYIKKDLRERTPDRIIVFSDSQDCDRVNSVPSPFGTRNYIVDVSSHARGINYKGIWTAEIAGWSERFLSFIAACEGLALPEVEQ